MAYYLGRYELIRPLSHGGMGEVFVARRRGPGGVEKRLVVKRIRPSRASDPRFIDMFVEEARLSMSLVHKNIVPVFDFGRAGDDLFLAMELVDGPDLAAILDHLRGRDKRLEPLLVAYIAMEACGALDYAHHLRDEDGHLRAIVHRDITPRNVLISRAGEVKLVDFGIATARASQTQGRVRGTPAYMSPEQARGDHVDGRSDLFSLGLVMWEILSGKRAYTGRSTAESISRARAGEVPPLDKRVPAALATIVARATHIDLEQRYPDARTMQLALDEYVVSARAEHGGAPPSHRLAELLADHPSSSEQDRDSGEWQPKLPSGPVVTCLDDGEIGVAKALTNSTLRSIAETVFDDDESSRAGSTSVSEPPAAEQTPKSGATQSDDDTLRIGSPQRVPWALVITALALAGAVTFSPHFSGSDDGKDENQGRETTAAVTVREASPIDAGVAVKAAASESDRDVAPAASGPASVPAKAPAAAPAAGANSARAETRRDAPAKTRQDTRAKTRRDTRKPRGKSAKPEVARSKREPRRELGTLRINAVPWARVTIPGTKAGCDETPCTRKLPAGTYTIVLENPIAGLKKSVRVQVIANETRKISEVLTQ